MPVAITISRPTFSDVDTLNAAAFDAVAISSALVPDATGVTEGVVRLAGDLTGTAAAPAIKTDVALGGNPTTTTQAAGNNTTRIATTAFVAAAITALINASPAALDTLNELAAALGNDANYAATITAALALKAPLNAATMTNIDIQSGNAILSICRVTRLQQDVNGGYVTSGAISLGLNAASNAGIDLTGDSVISVAGQAAGYEMRVRLKNATGGVINMTWPGWTVPAGTAFPATLAAGATIILRLYAYGATTADVVACLN